MKVIDFKTIHNQTTFAREYNEATTEKGLRLLKHGSTTENLINIKSLKYNQFSSTKFDQIENIHSTSYENELTSNSWDSRFRTSFGLHELFSHPSHFTVFDKNDERSEQSGEMCHENCNSRKWKRSCNNRSSVMHRNISFDSTDTCTDTLQHRRNAQGTIEKETEMAAQILYQLRHS
jgi:hypothetical protein